MNKAAHRPKIAVETTRPFRELFDALEEAGFDTEHRAPFERKGADVAEVLSIYLLQKLADPEVERVTEAVKAWVASWLRPRLKGRANTVSGRSIPIYGPQGEVLSRVAVDEERERVRGD